MGSVRFTVEWSDEFAEILRKRREKYGRNQSKFINEVIRRGLDKLQAEPSTKRRSKLKTEPKKQSR
jgi:hypothetical protein